jgi:alpha,alpha-trehalase
VLNFTDTNFAGEGRELAAVALANFDATPKFLDGVKDGVVKAWTQTVHGYWTQLIRDTNETTLCSHGECESSLIPLNHTFVVPGGRFREQCQSFSHLPRLPLRTDTILPLDYWDSFWIVEGLLRSELYDIANGTLQNFMDEIAQFGFIPNGGRIYYLDRSQPPLFTAMLSAYVQASNDTAILKRGLPLAEKELQWWAANRAVSVTSPFGSQKNHTLFRYAVNNTAPRPESYLQDYTTANDPSLPALNETQRGALYGELASGAETGKEALFAVCIGEMDADERGQDGTTLPAGCPTTRSLATRLSVRSASRRPCRPT